MNSQLAYHASAARIEALLRTAASRHPSLSVEDREPVGSRLGSLVPRRLLVRLRPRTAC